MSVEISVVVPVYNEEESVPELHRRLTDVLGRVAASYEIVLVDDGSRDRSWELIRELASKDSRVRGLSFSRNFGHQMAFTAGLDHVDGDAVVIMDADLQDPPEVIPELVARWREGYDVVFAVRAKREGETAFKLVTAAAFYRVLRRVTNVNIPVDTGDFRLMSRKAANAFRRLREHHRFTRGMVSWLGFKQVGVEYLRASRHAGETKYTMRKMLRLASDGLTSFSYLPLQLASWLGVAVSALAGLALLAELVVKAAGSALGWMWIGMTGLALLGGLQLIALGLVGEYLGRVFDDVRGRPLYLVQETVNLRDPSAAR